MYFTDLFELVKRPDLDHLTQIEFNILMKEMSGGSHVPSSILDKMLQTTWENAARKGKLDLKQFRKYISPFELHAVMTVDYV